VRWDDLLDGHVAAEQLVAASPDHAHAAMAERLAEAIAPAEKPVVVRSWHRRS
jgi:hypothetical protein